MQAKGRTPSPFASSEGMGAHTTAWIVHLDAIETSLKGKTVKEGLKKLDEKKRHAVKEANKRKAEFPDIDGYSSHGLETSEKRLDQIEKDKESSRIHDIIWLQNYIAELLTYTNYMPGATLLAADIGGKGEGKHRSTLLEWEKKLSQGDTASEEENKKIKLAVSGLLDLGSAGNKKEY